MKLRKILIGMVIVALVVLSFIVYSFGPTKQTSDSLKPFYVGIETGWDSNVSDCRALIDRVKDYNNLFIIASRLIVSNEALLNETCDYAYNAGMYFTVYFQSLTNSTSYPGTIGHFAPASWFTSAKERYSDKLLGMYFYDEAGGAQLDLDNDQNILYPPDLAKPPQSYSDYAAKYYWLWTRENPAGSIPQVANFTHSLNSTVLTSDYALYWFDYRVGYDTVLAQIGWNNSRQLQISLLRGAATVYNKDWGTIITWTYTQLPYLESAAQLYDDMVLAYNSGARYIAIYDSSQNFTTTTLTEDHFNALKQFWSYVQHNPNNQGSLKADTALVLPKDYGFGFRSPTDSVWRYRQADTWTKKMYSDVTDLINQYDSSIDIVFSDREFQNLIQNKYCKVLYWPRDFEANTSYLIVNDNNMLGYNTIQEAMNSFATYQGDSILVKPGTYQENIVITKPVTLKSQNSSTTIIDGSGSGTVLTIATDNVTINGFTFQNSGSLGAGILLENAHICAVINNTVINNHEGIVLDNSSDNVLKGNNIYHNSYNLVLKNSSPNDIDTSNKVDGKPYTSG